MSHCDVTLVFEKMAHIKQRTEQEMELMVSAHMDDFKGTGPQHALHWLRDILAEAFGVTLKWSRTTSSFTRA